MTSLLPALLAIAGALIGIHFWRRSSRETRTSAAIDQAMRRGHSSETQATSSRGQAVHRVLVDLLESLGSRFHDGRLGRHLVSNEDVLLLNVVGHDDRSGRAIFLAVRLALPLLLALLAAALVHFDGIRRLAMLFAALCAGVLLPKWALGLWAGNRRRRAHQELPLLVDLLRLLQGTGFSMDQSLQMISDRFRAVMPVLSRELVEANTYYAHGRSREQSLMHLRNAYEDHSIRSLVQLILQVHQHGGAVQEPLREFGERLREQRLMEMKERAGKLSVKMTMVMMLTLLPALMAVLIGPAIIAIQGTMSMLHSPI